MESSERIGTTAGAPPTYPPPVLARATGEPYRLELGLPALPGVRGELLVLSFFLLAALVLSWPIAITLDQASGLRGDYFNNLWNGWWMGHALREGHSPYWTDFLYFPEGISLARHTLSPFNSLFLAASAPALGSHQAFNVLLLAHFALSGWAFSFLARYVTGSTAGGVLGGLVYSFCPFHYFYLCQINVFSFEFLPLGLLFFVRYYRGGARRDLVGIALSMAGMVMSAEYYVVYTYLALGLLLFSARSWAGEVKRSLGLRRMVVAGGLGALVVCAVAFPLLYATLGPERGAETGTAAFSFEKHRTNDLLGFYWIGPKEESIVSWPTMLGYSTLAFLVLGLRHLLRLWPWLVVGGVFFVLSLGESLQVGGEDTRVPLPYALFGQLPVLSMLRKSDRAFMMVELVAALAVAGVWAGLSRALRARAPRMRIALWSACAAVFALELGALPLGRYDMPTSPYLREMAGQEDVQSVMELPAARTHVGNGRFLYLQTLHEKKSTLGYTTALAVTPFHDQRVEDLINWYWEFLFERTPTLVRRAVAFGIDRFVHYKTLPIARRKDPDIHGLTIWKPFFLVRGPLVRVRQMGEFDALSLERTFGEVVRLVVPELIGEIPAEKDERPFLDEVRMQFTRACGPPLFEDENVLVFAVPRQR